MNLLQYVKVHGETTLRSPGGGKRKGRFKDRPFDLLSPFYLVHWNVLFRIGGGPWRHDQ